MTSPLNVPLYRAAHGRTGDKGNRSNISVIAWHPALWDTLRRAGHRRRGGAPVRAPPAQPVTRHLLPQLQAMNFVLDDVLDGGVNDALNLDSHGKALSFLLLEMPIAREPDTGRPPGGQRDRRLNSRTHLQPTGDSDMNAHRRSPRRACLAAGPCRRLRRAGADRIRASRSRFIVPFAAGSATDQLARALGQSITDRHQAGGGHRQQGRRQRHAGGAGGGARRRPTATPCSSPPTPRTRPTSTCTRSCPTTR